MTPEEMKEQLTFGVILPTRFWKVELTCLKCGVSFVVNIRTGEHEPKGHAADCPIGLLINPTQGEFVQ